MVHKHGAIRGRGGYVWLAANNMKGIKNSMGKPLKWHGWVVSGILLALFSPCPFNGIRALLILSLRSPISF